VGRLDLPDPRRDEDEPLPPTSRRGSAFSRNPLQRVLEEAWFCEGRAVYLHRRRPSRETWEWLMFVRQRRIELEELVKVG
jgi:hypothetical protein